MEYLFGDEDELGFDNDLDDNLIDDYLEGDFYDNLFDDDKDDKLYLDEDDYDEDYHLDQLSKIPLNSEEDAKILRTMKTAMIVTFFSYVGLFVLVYFLVDKFFFSRYGF